MGAGAARSDAEVIAASLEDGQAFGELFDRHARQVMRFLARRIGQDEAGALTSEVFQVAFERRGVFSTDRDSALPWLYGIAANLLRNHRRSQSRRLAATARAAIEGEAAVSPEAALDARLVLPRLAEAIEALPDGEREALLLFALEELGYADIAAAVGAPVGTVRSRINRARGRLRERLCLEPPHGR
jgi:RNA polymerase sigma-70 factor (ECF subfamily)